MNNLCLAIMLALVTAASSYAQRENVTSFSTSSEKDIRDHFGLMEITDPARFHIRYFRDPYPAGQSDDKIVRDFRWRIYCPDASRFNIYWSSGILPDDGFPKDGRAIIPNPLPEGPVDVILVIHANSTDGGSFRFRMYPECESTRPPHQGFRTTEADWLPYYKSQPCVEENPSRDETIVFDLNEHFTVMKHFTLNDNMEKLGFMIWLEKTE